jgi:hypothetical protein
MLLRCFLIKMLSGALGGYLKRLYIINRSFVLLPTRSPDLGFLKRFMPPPFYTSYPIEIFITNFLFFFGVYLLYLGIENVIKTIEYARKDYVAEGNEIRDCERIHGLL